MRIVADMVRSRHTQIHISIERALHVSVSCHVGCIAFTTCLSEIIFGDAAKFETTRPTILIHVVEVDAWYGRHLRRHN